MKTILSFERRIEETTQKLRELTFLPGDYYNIYNHMVTDSGFAENPDFINMFCGFRVTDISDGGVEIEKLLPPVQSLKIARDSSVEMDFGRYGTYSVSLVTIGE